MLPPPNQEVAPITDTYRHNKSPPTPILDSTQCPTPVFSPPMLVTSASRSL
ncbi:hypothetical protein PISMIDRAFT_14383 [Pisolithus microcarpus 441]|uniref:Unplaced genomic scaffold scaffold_122, whole genome shotgun sequence n=1 Tax=Pisolithus microcarpus 441 TaxID=765257 RepID=A0A0C9Z7N0_9AGAM|nr:hypothetical protein PISMIDRAFT_14383 [Pisolithus microcarpus 441]